jgi:hypothetical protein
MNKWLMVFLMFVGTNSYAIDFSKGDTRGLFSKEKNPSLIVGQQFKNGIRGELAVSDTDGSANFGLGISKSILEFWNIKINLKGGYSVRDDLSKGNSGANVGMELEYHMGKNKSFVLELANKYDPGTKQLSDVVLKTGFRYSF